ncbi:Syntaxin-binding protein 6, partial [Goodea atripinnis]
VKIGYFHLTFFPSLYFGLYREMSAKSAINKELFTPHDEKMLAGVQVKRRTKKKIPFLATGGQGDYMTFICLSGRNVFYSAFVFK